MVITAAEFIKSAENPSQYPPPDVPEIAFSGRSNVGKSSLINRLVNRHRLVKTSATPGRTRLINFFLINNAFAFVDLPGYGYAKVPASVQKKWGPMVEAYFSARSTLKGVVAIFDIRRIPGPADQDLIAWIHRFHLSIVPVLTKTDKLSKSKQLRQRQVAAEALSLDPQDLILFSAKSGKGKEAVWQGIEGMLA